MKNFTKTILASALLLIMFSSLGWGQSTITFGWDFGTSSGNANADMNVPVTNLTISPLSQGNNNGITTLLTSSSVSSGYTGASGTYNAGAAARTGSLVTGTSGSAYFEFTLTPASGYIVNLNSISFGSRETSTGPKAYTLRSSLDSYSSDIATSTLGANSTWTLKSNSNLNTNSLNGTAITFRIYGYNGSGSASANTANWRIDDLSLIVKVYTVPTNQSQEITFSSVSFNQITASWTSGNGAYRIVKVNTINSFNDPVDGNDYTANSTYVSGEQIVYKGNSNSMTVTGLSSLVTYWFRVYDFNGTGNGTKYITTPSSNNPNSQSTTSSSTPTISVSSTMTDFGNVTVNTNSTIQSYTISGSNLTAGIVITPPTGFQISTSNSPFTSTNPITLAQTGGTVSNTTIYVMFTPTTVSTYNNSITHTSDGSSNPSLTVSGTGISPSNPTTFTANVTNQTEIELTATSNANNNSIVVVYNETGTFSAPTDGVAPGNIGDPFANGTIVYKGDATSLDKHTGLTSGTIYFYKAFSYDAYNFYSEGATAKDTTLKYAPTVQASNITFTSVGNTSMTINWTNGDGDRRIVIINTVNSFTNPIDGTSPSASSIYSGSGEQTIYNYTSNYVTVTGLTPGTEYWFRVFEVNNNGSNALYLTSSAINNSNAQFTNTPAAFFEDFEVGTKGSYTLGSVTCTMGSWALNDALLGSTASDRKNGSQSVRLRDGDITMNFDITKGAREVTVYHAMYGSDLDKTWKLQKSTNGGTNWVDVGSEITTNSTTLTAQVFLVKQSGTVRFRILNTSVTTGLRVSIDDITITEYDKTVTATSTLSNTEYGNLTINGSGITVNLIGNTTVNGVLTLTSGKLVTASDKKLILGTGATITGGSSTSFIDGPLEINTNSTDQKTVHIGSGTNYRTVGVKPETADATTFSIQFNNFAYSDTSTFTAPLVKVSTREHYIISRTSGIANANVTIGWDSLAGITNLGNLKVGRWNSSSWVDAGRTGFTGDEKNGTITSGLITSFSPFAIASTSDQPLPVHLSSLSSSINKRNITLNWSTSSEANNSGFEVERKGINESNWMKAGFVIGSGNSNSTKNYSFTDRGLQTGKYRYRLKQIDFNGNYEFYDLNGYAEVGVPNKYDISQNYPNPFNPVTKIDYDLPYDSKVSIKIYDVTGREVKNLFSGDVKAGYYTQTFDASSLSSGVYFYRVVMKSGNADFVQSKKMVLLK